MRRTFRVHVDGIDVPMVVIVDPNEDDLVDMRERYLLRTWRKAGFAKNRPPTIGELGVDVIEELEPNLMELAWMPDGDLNYRSFGKAIKSAFGRDMTGRRMSELDTPAAKTFFSLYRLAANQKIAYATRYKPPPPATVGHWHRLILPTSDPATGEIGGFLVCNLPIG